MMPERSEVLWGKTRIPYTVQRSSRRGTVSVAVEPSGSVVLTAPTTTPIPRLDRVVRAKARWIVERVRRRSDVPPAMEREFVSGESFTYLGRSFLLLVREHAAASPALLERGRLVVAVERGLGSTARSADVRRTLVSWFREHAKVRLRHRASYWAEKLRLEAPEVRIVEQPKRWGSCASGIIRLNWRIVQAPSAIVDYVVAHEVNHLRHEHHDDRFWSALGRIMSDYEQRKARLKELGPRLIW